MQKARRDFLKTMGAGSALLVSGCSSFDKWVIGDIDDNPQKVLIIGGGLAGLTAAYELKKRQIPFRLIEASSRVGGRVWTVKSMNVSSQNADLGGENIEHFHDSIQNIAKELKLNLNEIAPQISYAFSGLSQSLGAKEMLREGKKLEDLGKKIAVETYGSLVQFLNQKNSAQFSKAVILDQMPASELIQSLSQKLGTWVKPFLNSVVVTQWGVSPDQLSALHLLHWLRDTFTVQRRKFLRIDGGMETLAQALFDRVAGVIPERIVNFQHVLKRIDKKDEKWSLEFETPQGRKEFLSEAVICTLPPSQMSAIKGWENLAAVEGMLEGPLKIDMGSQSKILLSFKNRFWKEDPLLGKGGSLVSENGLGELSHAGGIPHPVLGTVHGILQSQTGGEMAEKVNPETVKSVVESLAKINPLASNFENIFQMQNWKSYPWAKGSRAYPKPGQYSSWNEERPTLTPQSWFFAGDAHSLRFMGTMNGAIESAIVAVNKAAEALA